MQGVLEGTQVCQGCIGNGLLAVAPDRLADGSNAAAGGAGPQPAKLRKNNMKNGAAMVRIRPLMMAVGTYS